MKRFKTYVITKKTLKKVASIIILCIMFSIILTITIVKNKPTETVAVFSNNATNILDKGVVSDKKTTPKKLLKEIIGFSADDPVSIINSSSAAFKNTKDSTPPPSKEKTQINNQPKKTELVSHELIINSVGLKMNNATNYEVDIDELCEKPLDIKLEFNEPEVLIIHTHTTECYNGNEMTGESERTTNERYNMCRIGEIVAKTLESHGIRTIHDKTIHDYPSYQGAYTRTLKTIEKNIEKYPSIKVVLDIHRDAYVYADGSKLRVATETDKRDAAQVMLVLGTDSMGLEHASWESNLTLASKVQNAAEIMYPGLMRPLNLRRERFNMHVTKGSLLLEIGSNGNIIEEAEVSAEYIGNAIASALING